MSKFFKALEQAGRAVTPREPQPPVEPEEEVPAATVATKPAATEAVVQRPRVTPPPAPPDPAPAVPPTVLSVKEAERAPVVAPPRRPPESQPAPQRPELDHEASQSINGHLISLLQPASFEAEQYRALRHLVEQFRGGADVAVIAISSAAIGDGKTTTAINLAGSLAQGSDARVLLIDADLRRPSVVAQLGMTPGQTKGVVDYVLDGSVKLETLTTRHPAFNLSIVSSGMSTSVPYEILKSARFGELLDEARQGFDYIIVDTPPSVGLPDCRVLSRWLDGFLLVVGAHKTPRRLLEEALKTIEPEKLIGLVFNNDDRPMSGYYRGYGYGHTPSRSSKNGNGRLRRAFDRTRDALPQRRRSRR
jgi:receptor protein-tyrosine kinase